MTLGDIAYLALIGTIIVAVIAFVGAVTVAIVNAVAARLLERAKARREYRLKVLQPERFAFVSNGGSRSLTSAATKSRVVLVARMTSATYAGSRSDLRITW